MKQKNRGKQGKQGKVIRKRFKEVFEEVNGTLQRSE